MGNAFFIKCDCGERQDFYLGGGMIRQETLVYKEIMEDDNYADIRQFVDSTDDLSSAEKRLYQCKNCGILETHSYFRLVKNPEYCIKRFCPECGKRMAQSKLDSELFKYFNAKKMLETGYESADSECSIKIKCQKCKAMIKPKSDFSNIGFVLWD